MSDGLSIIRPSSEKSNVELINSLKSNFKACKQAFEPITNGSTHTVMNDSRSRARHNIPYTTWTSCEGDRIHVPSIDFSQPGLAEERSEYDITVKLFFLSDISASKRCMHTQEAVGLVLDELHASSVDLLIASFPGVSFDADDDEQTESPEGCNSCEADNMDTITETWRAFEKLHTSGVALQIGLSEFGTERLKKFLPRTVIRPSVDQINVRDCCVVPKSLILYAKAEKIELLTHSDCTNILPSGTLREILGMDKHGAGVLAGPEEGSQGLKGEVEPQWVVKYTAVVRDRGVIENKGYFAMAELRD